MDKKPKKKEKKKQDVRSNDKALSPVSKKGPGESFKKRHGVNKESIFHVEYYIIWNTHQKKDLFVDQKTRNFVRQQLKAFAKGRKWTIKNLLVDKNMIEIQIIVTPEYSPHKVFSDLRRSLNDPLKAKYPQLKTKAPTLWHAKYYAQTIGKIDPEKALEFSL